MGQRGLFDLYGCRLINAERIQMITVVFKPNVRITCVDGLCTEDANSTMRVHFNTGRYLAIPKSALGVLYLLNGHFTVEQITNFDSASKEVLDKLSILGLVIEQSADFNNNYIHAKNKLINYAVHFPKMTNINIMMAVLLQKLRVKTIFYESNTITQDDINQNIYFNFNDVGKATISFLQDENKVDTVCFSDCAFNLNDLNKNIDIVVNSDVSDWVDSESCITINTWHYSNTYFDDFSIFNCKVNISDNLKALVEGYILAIRSVDDILHSVAGGVVF